MRAFVYNLPKNVAKIFSGYNLLWHLLAIILTYIIVVSGFDWRYFLLTSKISWLWLLFPAIIFGGILPIIVPLALLAIGSSVSWHSIK